MQSADAISEPSLAANVFFRTLLRFSRLALALALLLSLPSGCDSPAASRAAAETESYDMPQLIHQPGGQEWMVIKLSQIAGLSIGRVQEVALPGILEAVGQVTFDDRLVATIISRVSGRLEDIRVSQWDTVRAGENILSLYSP